MSSLGNELARSANLLGGVTSPRTSREAARLNREGWPGWPRALE